jgi:MYXO-CTERM domain-containing protein
MRMEGDVAMVADPGTGMSIYTTLGANGWLIVGGTSAAAPLTAGALTNLGVANGHFTPAWIWQNPIDFFDVTSGSNGPCDAGDPGYYCNAGVGYDGPTGWGTVNGKLLATAIPPGGANSGACNLPAGSYSKSCAECEAGMRTTGCTLVCQTCTEIDGTLNPDPTLGLPCDGAVSNLNGQLTCVPAPDAGSEGDSGADASADAGAGAGADSGADASHGEDAGHGVDASAPSDGGAVASRDATADAESAVVAAATPSSSSGCACRAAPGGTAPRSALLAAALGLAIGIRRRSRRRR